MPPAQYLSLDTTAVLTAARGDPEGFIAGLEGAVVLDEVQRAPALALAIKASVDADRRPGRFLLTGSASALALPQLTESLAGRVELHTLWPFSQGELAGRRESFVERLFMPKLALPQLPPLAEEAILEGLLVGGYPEAISRKNPARRHAWFDSYITTILARDIRDLANIEKLAEVPRLFGAVGIPRDRC